MIKKEDIEEFISKLPPTPKIVNETIKLLKDGELSKAAKVASEDKALNLYLKDLLNKPAFGLSKEVNDTTQIFTILGISGSLQAIYNYLLDMISPKKWVYFKLNQKKFNNFQADLSGNWKKILNHLYINDKDIEASISLLPASVIICEALFNKHKNDVELIRSSSDIDLNTILKRLSSYDIFDISIMISKKWDMGKTIEEIIKYSSGLYNVKSENIVYSKWMHMLLFFIVSKPEYIESGLNDFIEFQIDFVNDIYEDFINLMGVE